MEMEMEIGSETMAVVDGFSLRLPVSGREESLYIGVPSQKLFRLIGQRWRQLYGGSYTAGPGWSRRIVAHQTSWSLLSSPGFFGWFGILYI